MEDNAPKPDADSWPYKYAKYFEENVAELKIRSNLGDTLRINYVLFGSGEYKVVLIPGLTSTWRQWEFVLPYFKARPECSLLTMDLRGVGKSDIPKGRYTTKMLAEDIHKLIQHVGWGGKPCHIIGNSMGGMITLEFACTYPEMVASAYFGVTHYGGMNGIPPMNGLGKMMGQMWHQDDKVKRAQLYVEMLFSKEWAASSSMEGAIAEGRTNGEFFRDVVIERLDMGSQNFQGFWSQSLAVLTHRVTPQRLQAFGKSGIPFRVSLAEADMLVKPANCRALARLLDAEPTIYRGSGHAIGTECFHQFCDELWELIREGEGRLKK